MPDPRFNPQPQRVVDLSRLRNPAPITPIVINVQIQLVAESEGLPQKMQELMHLLETLAASGKRKMEQHNEEIRKAQQNGHDSEQPKGGEG